MCTQSIVNDAGSKWTARERTFGRTHFFVAKLHACKAKASTYALMVRLVLLCLTLCRRMQLRAEVCFVDTFCETTRWHAMQVAACGTSNQTQFWLNTRNLKSRDLWSSGWLQRSQRLTLADGGPPCKVCRSEAADEINL